MSVRSMVRVMVGLSVLAGCGALMALGEPGGKPAAKPTDKPAKTEPSAKATLAVGDGAPKIDVDEWIKGEPVTGFEVGKVYVVEFWATWCGPCIRAIPHLTELQKKHEKVTFIGVAASERKEKDGSDKRLENVRTFVEKQGDKMGYRVAFDADRAMAESWLRAAGKTSIPTSFIVDSKGKVAWVGHPNKLGPELEKVLDASALGGKPVKPNDE